jgi:formylmethanofuran dehydrogenase subunit B
VDAVLIAAADPLAALSDAAIKNLEEIPLIVIDSQNCAAMEQANVAFISAAEGIHVEGTLFRMDDAPLRMRKLLSSPCSSREQIFRRLLSKAKELKGC